MIDNNVFLQTIIKSTKNNNLEWYKLDKALLTQKSLRSENDVYAAKRSESIIVLRKYQYTNNITFTPEFITGYSLTVCDGEYNIVYVLDEEDFEQGELSRLYRLVERNASKVDSRLEKFIEGF